MDWLTLIFGIVGIVSFVFSIYTYFKTESKKAIEAANNAMYKEMARNVQLSLVNILNTIDTIVQLPKHEEVSVEQLQHLARIARREAVILAKQMKARQRKLESWQFGKLIESDFGDDIENELAAPE